MRRRLRRRGFLGVVATAALAGCSDVMDDEPTRLDGEELTALADRETPSVPETVPAPIESSYLDRAERRARDLLVVVPDPLEPRHVPNGAIREEIQQARDGARESFARAASATTPFERMDALRSARGDAANAAAAWRAVDEGYGRADVVAAAPPLAEDVAKFRDELAYVGGDAADAVLVYAAIERRARRAEREVSQLVDREFRRPENPPSVGEAAEHLERARASLDDARHLAERYRGSLSSGRSVRGLLERASDDLSSAVDAEYRTLPDESAEPSSYVDRDVSDTPAAWILQQSYAELDWMRDESAERRDEGDLANAVMAAHEAFVQRNAFARLRERVASGEDFAVSTVDDVRTMRANAVSAVESTLAATPTDLNRHAVHDPAQQIGYTDARFADVRDRPTAEQVAHDATDYVLVAAVASSIPGASDRVVDALRNAG